MPKKSFFIFTLLFFSLFINFTYGNQYLFPSSIFKEIPLGTSDKYENFSQLNPSVAPLSDGGFACVWEKGEWPHRNVVMQWISPRLIKKFGPEEIMVTASNKEEAQAVIVPHATSGVFVAYEKKTISGTRIKIQYFNQNAEPVWKRDGVFASPYRFSENQNEPHLVPDPHGGVYVCFRVWHFNPSKPRQIRCQHLDENGKRAWNRNKEIAGGVKGLKVYAKGVVDDQGGVMVFWRNQRYPYMQKDNSMLMEGQRFSPKGKKLWGNQGKTIHVTNLAPSNGWGFTHYDAVSDGNGGAILAFNDWVNFNDPNLDVVAQRVSSNGDLLWKKGAVVTEAPGHQQHSATIPQGNGGAFVVVYHSISSSQNELYVYRLNPKGKHKWTKEGVLLSDPSLYKHDYGVSGSFDKKKLRLIWTHHTALYSYNFDVMMAELDANGKFIGSPARKFLVDAKEGQFTRDMAYNIKSEKYFCVWDDYRNDYTFGDCDVYGGGEKKTTNLVSSKISLNTSIPFSTYSENHYVRNGKLCISPIQNPYQIRKTLEANGKNQGIKTIYFFQDN